ncbi:MAG: glycosyltransferase family 4 protein [Gemmatimonadota bacterium]|nr:glycosyltransferase family 4 protein [Gemmatimonadota bacterium]
MFPWPLNFGGRQRIFHLARGIAAAHNVSVIAFNARAESPSPENVAAFLSNSGCKRVTIVPRNQPERGSAFDSSILGRMVEKVRSVDAHLRSPLPTFVRDVWSRALVSAIRSFADECPVDVVYAARSWMAEHARAAGLSPIAVDVDDLVSVMSKQRVSSSGWHRRKLIEMFDTAKESAYEKKLPERFARVIVVKQEDRDFFPAVDHDRVSVVPNGITIPSAPIPEPLVADTLLFVGTLGYGPNIDAARWFVTEVLPLIWRDRPDVRLNVAGYGSGGALRDALGDPRCILHESPDDLVPLYAQAALVVAPVRRGGGTKIKILEALAHGRAVVATPFAAEGLGLRRSVDIELAESPAEMAALAIALLADRPRRIALAKAGRAQVVERFDWRRIESALPELVSSLCD